MTESSQCFDRPVWTLDRLIDTLPSMPRHIARVLPTVLGRTLSNQFRERIMLAVTAENRCPYCERVHTRLGRLAGMSSEDVGLVMQGRDEELPPGERLALAFVRDLARKGFRSRDEGLLQELGGHFSAREIEAIESSAHVINWVNRFYNTFDYLRALRRDECREEREAALRSVTKTATFLIGAAGIGAIVGPLMVYQRIRT